MKQVGQNRLEWALLVLIAAVCTVLSILQYRWTGEVSRAERARLGSALSEQAGRLARAFDDELRESCRALIPDAAELREQDIFEAHRSQYEQWASTHERSLFSRIGVAVPEQPMLRLYSLEREGRMKPVEWPANWETLRTAMTSRMQGPGPPPSVPPGSTLLESPIVDSARRRDNPRPEFEWMIFEVSEDHLRTKTLPRLVAEYFGSGNEALYDVSVSWTDASRPVIFSTGNPKSSAAQGADLSIGIFSSNIAGPADRRQRRFGREGARPRWTLAMRHAKGHSMQPYRALERATS